MMPAPMIAMRMPQRAASAASIAMLASSTTSSSSAPPQTINPTGISHSPEEFATSQDCLAGVQALTTVLTDLSGVS